MRLFAKKLLNDSGDIGNWTLAKRDLNLGQLEFGWYGITYNEADTSFTVISRTGYISTTIDGINWTVPLQKLGNNNWSGIAVKPASSGQESLYIALGKNGAISTSNNLTTWSSAQNKLGYYNWTSITYGDGEFVAISEDGYYATTTDGETWSTVPSSLAFEGGVSVAYGNSAYVAIDENGNMYLAPSGTGSVLLWVPLQNPLSSSDWSAITYAYNKYIAVSEAGYYSESSNMTDWGAVIQNPNLGNNNWNAATYGNGKVIALGSSGYVSIMRF